MDPPARWTKCGTCEKQIAIDAEACPACGAVNKYVHPCVARFIEELARFGEMPRFTVTHDKFLVVGLMENPKTTKSLKTMHIGSVIALAAIVLCCVDFALAVTVMLIATAFCAFGQIRGGVDTNTNLRFQADFSSGTLRWFSDDDKLWAPVKAFFTEADQAMEAAKR